MLLGGGRRKGFWRALGGLLPPSGIAGCSFWGGGNLPPSCRATLERERERKSSGPRTLFCWVDYGSQAHRERELVSKPVDGFVCHKWMLSGKTPSDASSCPTNEVFGLSKHVTRGCCHCATAVQVLSCAQLACIVT